MFDGIDASVQPLFIAPAHLPVWADRVRPHLIKMAEGSGGRYEASDILFEIARGSMQLWIALLGTDILCAVVSEVHSYPRLRALRLIGVVGHRPLLWRRLLRVVEEAAKRDFGCTMMEGFHNPEHMALLPKYRMTHWFSEKVIG
jgi:hypothetical protein